MNSNVQTMNGTFLGHFAAMLLAAVLVTSTAFADEQVRSETVKFGDLNVGTSAGAEALYVRIHAAAKRVCTQLSNDVWASNRMLSCITSAEAKAIEKVNLPLLTSYYQTKTGGQPKALIATR
jgi:UrcA family protein